MQIIQLYLKEVALQKKNSMTFGIELKLLDLVNLVSTGLTIRIGEPTHVVRLLSDPISSVTCVR